jgi:hypothetical protein
MQYMMGRAPMVDNAEWRAAAPRKPRPLLALEDGNIRPGNDHAHGSPLPHGHASPSSIAAPSQSVIPNAPAALAIANGPAALAIPNAQAALAVPNAPAALAVVSPSIPIPGAPAASNLQAIINQAKDAIGKFKTTKKTKGKAKTKAKKHQEPSEDVSSDSSDHAEPDAPEVLDETPAPAGKPSACPPVLKKPSAAGSAALLKRPSAAIAEPALAPAVAPIVPKAKAAKKDTPKVKALPAAADGVPTDKYGLPKPRIVPTEYNGGKLYYSKAKKTLRVYLRKGDYLDKAKGVDHTDAKAFKKAWRWGLNLINTDTRERN